MVTRRQAREWAVMMLCECDLNPPDSLDAALAAFWEFQEDVERNSLDAKEFGVKKAFCGHGAKNAVSLIEMKEFAEVRVAGVLGALQEIDGILVELLDNWDLYRLGTVERAVLRMGIWEMKWSDVPKPVVINEAIDLANWFSTPKSRTLINAVLDKYGKRG